MWNSKKNSNILQMYLVTYFFWLLNEKVSWLWYYGRREEREKWRGHFCTGQQTYSSSLGNYIILCSCVSIHSQHLVISKLSNANNRSIQPSGQVIVHVESRLFNFSDMGKIWWHFVKIIFPHRMNTIMRWAVLSMCWGSAWALWRAIYSARNSGIRKNWCYL